MATVLSACLHLGLHDHTTYHHMGCVCVSAVQTLALTELVTSVVAAAAGTAVVSERAQSSKTFHSDVSVAAAHNHSRTLLLLLLVFRQVLESDAVVVVAAVRLVNTVYSNYRDNNLSVAASTTHAAVLHALAVCVVATVFVIATLAYVSFARAHMLSLAVLAMFSVSLSTLHVALQKQTEGRLLLLLQLKIADLRLGQRELG